MTSVQKLSGYEAPANQKNIQFISENKGVEKTKQFSKYYRDILKQRLQDSAALQRAFNSPLAKNRLLPQPYWGGSKQVKTFGEAASDLKTHTELLKRFLNTKQPNVEAVTDLEAGLEKKILYLQGQAKQVADSDAWFRRLFVK